MRKRGKVISRTLLVLLGIILLAVACIYITGHGYVFRAVQKTFLKGYKTTNIDDYPDFDNNIIEAGEPQYWDYHPEYGKIELTDTLRKELEDFHSIGFAIVKDGKMLYEEYWDDYSDESHTNSFSMAKTITIMLLGKAIEEGYIKGMDQKIIDFIPEFKDDPYAQLCTIAHLSSMTSGFDWKENYYSPFSITTEAYFGKDIQKQILKRKFAEKPGGLFKYSSADTQILAIILKRATNKSLSQYLSESFWKPMGMEHDALWSLSGGIEKSFCCVHSNVRDFAKLGQLLLQKGKWKDKQLLDSAFVEMMISPNYKAFEPDMPKKYGHSIWIDEEYNPTVYGMLGHLGQRVLVLPEYNTIIVRLGKHQDYIRKSKGHLDFDIYRFIDEVVKILPKDTTDYPVEEQESN
ncbi:beta-lactamase family protein [Bacteroidales bacterium OttesenSCG-928-I14]|nr:beta-lactamase family protein [Bacteroidales bacterium OttesenSCG-928-I14]